MWLITNKSLRYEGKFSTLELNGYKILTDQSVVKSPKDNTEWLINGFLLPRGNGLYVESKDKPSELLNSLFLKHGDDFINQIKGSFVLIRITKDGFTIFSDPFAIRKYFIWINDNEFIISSDLKEISKRIDLKPSSINIALYTLNYHFTGGTTLFCQVKHNQPGELLKYNKQRIEVKKYWSPERLLEICNPDFSVKRLSDNIKEVIAATVTSERSISLSLTGGGDTRNLLAVFLSLGIKPHLYTYGNPKSNDCIKASVIARGLKLNHTVHDVQIDSDTFTRRARDIIRLGGSLASIHRVHRLIAVEREKQFSEYMYLGSLGGEFVKGVSEDDYIIPSIVYQNWNSDGISYKLLEDYFEAKRLIVSNEVISNTLKHINSEPFMKGDLINRKLNSLSYITAHLHDAQDINLYRSAMNEVYTPFLDIEYLEALFSSCFSFNNKEKIKGRLLGKIQNPVYSSEFIRATYPPLLRFRYSGEHKPSEVLVNKYFAGFMKIIRSKITVKYPPNFPLGNWMKDFVKQNLPVCYDYNILRDTFNLDQLMKDLITSEHLPVESYWLKYTNPVMMRFIIEEFKNA